MRLTLNPESSLQDRALLKFWQILDDAWGVHEDMEEEGGAEGDPPVVPETLAIEDGDAAPPSPPPSPPLDPIFPNCDYYDDRVEEESVEEPMEEPAPQEPTPPTTSIPAPAGGVPGILQDQQQHFEDRKQQILAKMELLRRGFL